MLPFLYGKTKGAFTLDAKQPKCSVIDNLRKVATSRKQGMVWNGMGNGMEWKFRYEIWKMSEWNGKEDFKIGMEDNFPYFHTNSKLDFAHCAYTKIHTDVGW